MNQLILAYRIAQIQLGQKEIEGSKDNPKIVGYHKATTLVATDDETPWCSSFVNWCLIISAILLNPEMANSLLLKAKFEVDDIDYFFDQAIELNKILKIATDGSLLKRVNPKQVMPVVMLGTLNAMARSFHLFSKETKDPKEGDIVVLTRPGSPTNGHVAFLAKKGF